MATYIPNATQTTEPVESRTVESAALEFRTLKASINARIDTVQANIDTVQHNVDAVQDNVDVEVANRIAGDANLQTQNNTQDIRLTAVENALMYIDEGGQPDTVYVPRFFQQDGAGAIVRTAQDKMREIVSVKDFGAVGDGVADDSPAFQAAFDFMQSKSVCALFVPSGVYRLASRVSITKGANASYVIYGEGQSSVILGANADGAIRITCNNRHVYMTVANLCFSPSLENSGTAFEYTAPEGGVSQRNVFRMESCVFEPHIDTDTTSSWFNVIVVTGTNRPSFNNVAAWRQGGLKADVILNIDGCYKPIITDCYFNGPATYGISNIKSGDNEGCIVSNTTVNGADTGIYISQIGRHPEIWIVDSHLNNKVAGVHVANSKYIWLCRNLMYTSALTGESYSDYLIDSCNSVTIVDNVYRQGTLETPNRRHVNLINGSRLIKIADNGLNARTAIAPYYIDSTSRDVDIRLPVASASGFDNALYPSDLVDSASNIGIYVSRPDRVVQINDGSVQGPVFVIERDSKTPANNDSLGNLQFSGRNSDLGKSTFAQISVIASDVTAGSTKALLRFFVTTAGTANRELAISDGVMVGTTVGARGVNTLTVQGSNRLFLGLGASTGIYSGVGSPEGVVTATPGSLYLRTDGGAGTTMYVKESGASTTGWVAK